MTPDPGGAAESDRISDPARPASIVPAAPGGIRSAAPGITGPGDDPGTEATWEGMAQRALPTWYDDAKLGIVILWGPYSVPAWAPTGEMSRVVAEQGWDYWFSHNSHAEWYANSMAISGSPTQEHHRTSYRRITRYDAFARTFRQGLKDRDAAPLLDALAASGARYVVLAAKHHDGFLLWSARSRHPRKRGWQVTRDLVGEIASGTRARGLRFGLYYSGGLDWTFGGTPIRSYEDLAAAMPRTRVYAAYVDAHWRELIARYKPSILWNDRGCPPGQDLRRLFSTYYAAVPDGVVNDRFGQSDLKDTGSIGRRALRSLTRLFKRRGQRLTVRGKTALLQGHADFRTSEYEATPGDAEGKWECIRPIGCSFGLNTEETDDHMLSTTSLVRLLVDVVSRGGNLLLGVGPAADGSVSELQKARLAGLGQWLKLNGEAIYGSRPWGWGDSSTDDGIDIRFTTRGMTTYAILLGTPAGRTIVLPSLRLLPYAGLRIIGSIGYVAWFQEGKDIHIRLTEPLRESPAHVISITPQPRA